MDKTQSFASQLANTIRMSPVSLTSILHGKHGIMTISIRNAKSYKNIEEYIIRDPLNWENDKFYVE